MDTVVKRCAASGAVALMGAGAIFTTPIAQHTAVEMPALHAPVIELAAAPSWLEQLAALAGSGATDAGDIFADELAAPFPIVRQVIVNQLTNAVAVAIGAAEGGEAIVRGFEGLPAAIEGLFDDPAGFYSAVIQLVTQVVTQFPRVVFGPVLDAFAASVVSTIDNAVGVAAILAEGIPGLIEDVALVPLGTLEEAVRQAVIVAATAVTTPLQLPRAIGEAAYAVGTEAIGQVSVVVDDVIDIRGEVLNEVSPGGQIAALTTSFEVEGDASLAPAEDVLGSSEEPSGDPLALSTDDDADDSTELSGRRTSGTDVADDPADEDDDNSVRDDAADVDADDDSGPAAATSDDNANNDNAGNDNNDSGSNNNDSGSNNDGGGNDD